MKLVAILCALLFCAPVLAQAPTAPEKPVGLSGWRIGFSNALFLTAPSNLKSGGAVWAGEASGFLPSSWSGENDSVRVEIVRATAARFDELRQAAFAHIGGTGSAGRNSKLDSYDAVQLVQNGKTATVVRHAAYTWVVVILPGKAADAPAVSREVLLSLWFERAEKPEWKDRVVGYSWQAELPYELSEEYSESKNTERFRARWGDFSIETLKGGAYTDFDKTVDNQVEAMRRRTDIKDVKVQRFSREFGFEVNERGVVVQIDFLRGEEPHRTYKIASVTGYGALFTTITLKPGKPEHRAWAHRILSTLRLAYGVPGDNYKEVHFVGEPVVFESETAFRAPQERDGIRTFIGSDERNFLFSIQQGDSVITPLSGEMKGLGELTRDAMLGNLIKGMGGKLTKATILPAAVGAFPARRVRFEAEFGGRKEGGRRMFGDALSVLTAHNIYMPVYLTGTATNDKMPRAASTWRFDFPAPGGWTPQKLAGNFQLLLPDDARPTGQKGASVFDFNRDGVQVHVEVKPETFPDEITVTLDGLTEGEKADNPQETDYGALLRLRGRMERNYAFHWARTAIGEAQGVAGWASATDLQKMQDAIVLRHGTHSFLCEVIWNSKDAKSRATRDALLGSLRCDSSFVAPAPSTPLPNVPTANTPATNETDDWEWWWF